jgi:serine/threonine protein kinase
VSDVRDRLADALGPHVTLEREIGEGRATRTFVARDDRLPHEIVVRVLGDVFAGRLVPGVFAREMANAALLQDPRVVPVLSAGETADGVPYFTMPFVEGETLEARMARGSLTMADAVAVLREIAAALAYAHRRGVTHRNITPAHILLTGRSAVITDYGVAKALSTARNDATLTEEHGSPLAQITTTLGNPAYMAPEQAGGHPPDMRTDIYAWGAIAYELLGGRPLFPGATTDRARLAAQINESPPPLGEATGSGVRVPPALAALVMQCLKKDQSSRVEDGQQLLAALESPTLLAERAKAPPPRVPSGTAMDVPVAPKPPVPVWRTPAALGAIVVVVALIAATLMWIMR